MDIANIMLGIGGGRDNTIPKYRVTAAEIAVLRGIHGEDAVFDVEPLGSDKRTNRSELARLKAIYGGATDGNGGKIVDLLYPGAAARVFEKLDELDLPEDFFKAERRATAASAPEADHDPLDKMTKAELVAYAKTNGIEVDESAKKAEILQTIQSTAPAARDDEDDLDEIEDLPPAKQALFS